MELAARTGIWSGKKLPYFVMPTEIKTTTLWGPTSTDIDIKIGELWRGFYVGTGYFRSNVLAEFVDGGFRLYRTPGGAIADPNYGAGCLQFLKAGTYRLTYDYEVFDGTTNRTDITVYEKLDTGLFTVKTRSLIGVTASTNRVFTISEDSWCMFGFVCAKTNLEDNPITYKNIRVEKEG